MSNHTSIITMNSTVMDHHIALQWLIQLIKYRKEFFLQHVEPWIVHYLGPVVDDPHENILKGTPLFFFQTASSMTSHSIPSSSSTMSAEDYSSTDTILLNGSDAQHHHHHGRQLGLLPSYVQEESAYRETSMSFATLIMLFVMMSCILLILMSCFFHNQKSSPFFNSPRRHRLPKLVPPPLPVDGFFSWVRKKGKGDNRMDEVHPSMYIMFVCCAC
jgi:hypothetical protein